MYKEKYIKYKNKYKILKKMYGGSPPFEPKQKDDVCLECPTQNEVRTQLQSIISKLPSEFEGCLQYAFISDEINSVLKDKSKDKSNIPQNIIEQYELFLKEKFTFFNESENISMDTHLRGIITSYTDMELNSASTTWHQDTEARPDKTLYNVLYYLTLENCRSDCGTEIAFLADKKKQTIKLPICEGLIIALKDSCFSHKSPIINVIDRKNPAYRLIIRTYVYDRSKEVSEEVSKKVTAQNIQVNELSRELNLIKLEECLKSYYDYQKSKDDLEENMGNIIDCVKFITQIFSIYRSDIDFQNIFRDYDITNFNLTYKELEEQFSLK